MKKFLIIVLMVGLLFSVSACANGFWEPLSKTERILFVGFLVTEGVDWAMTRYISDNPNNFSEMNPILGEHPTIGEVDRYFSTCILGTYLITKALPDRLREPFLLSGIVFEVMVVKHNYELGVKFKF
jgi:hypothetical protein